MPPTFLRLAALTTMSVIAALNPSTASPVNFKPRLPDDQLDALVANINPRAIADAFHADPLKFPVCAVAISKVDAGSQAEKVGIGPGCLVIDRAGIPLATIGRWEPPMLDNPAGVVRWIDAAGSYREAQLEQGYFGIRYNPYRNLLAWYLAHGHRSTAWDEQVIAALVAQSKDPAAAESLWGRATSKGYPPDRFSMLCGMGIALAERDSARAAAFAAAFGPLEAPPGVRNDAPHWPADWQQVSMLTGDPQWTAASYKHFRLSSRGKWIGNSAMLQEQQQLRAAQAPTLRPPSELIQSMKRRSLLLQSVMNASWLKSNHLMQLHAKAVAAAHAGRDSFPKVKTVTHPGRVRTIWFGPETPAKNIAVTVRFTAKALFDPTADTKGNRPNFDIGLANRNADSKPRTSTPPGADILVTKLSFVQNGDDTAAEWWVCVPSTNPGNQQLAYASPLLPANTPSTQLVPPFVADGQPHTLQVIRINQQAEAILDGRRLALVHVPDRLDDPGVFIAIAGTSVTIDQLTADILE